MIFNVDNHSNMATFAEGMSYPIPYPPGYGYNGEKFMTPKQFQEEINQRISEHTGEVPGPRRLDPPPTAEPRRRERAIENVRLARSAPIKQPDRLLVKRDMEHSQKEVFVLKQHITKGLTRQLEEEFENRPRSVYFNFPEDECRVYSEMPPLDKEKGYTNHTMRKAEPFYALQRKYNPRRINRKSSDSAEDLNTEDEGTATTSKAKVSLSRCNALSFTRNELKSMSGDSLRNKAPRPVELFPYKPIRSASFVVSRKRNSSDQQNPLKRSKSQHAIHLKSNGGSDIDLNITSCERQAKDAIESNGIDSHVLRPINSRNTLRTPSSLMMINQEGIRPSRSREAKFCNLTSLHE